MSVSTPSAPSGAELAARLSRRAAPTQGRWGAPQAPALGQLPGAVFGSGVGGVRVWVGGGPDVDAISTVAARVRVRRGCSAVPGDKKLALSQFLPVRERR